MNLRIFTCSACGHKMRFAGSECGRCHTQKGVMQLKATYVILGILALLLLAYVGLIEIAKNIPE